MGKQTALTSFFGKKRASSEQPVVDEHRSGDNLKRCRTSDASSKREPRVLVCWNANGLPVRLRCNRDREGLAAFMKHYRPDVLCISEVRMAAALAGDDVDGARIADGPDRELVLKWLSTPRMCEYDVWYSLARSKYAGTCVLVKRDVSRPVGVRYRFDDGATGHDPDGRIIVIEFDRYTLVHTYAPNNGWEERSFARRRQWDAEMRAFMERMQERARPVIWLGDLNVAPADEDLSHPQWFRSQKSEKNPLPRDPADRGQPGCTDNERRRLAEIMEAGLLVDAYRLCSSSAHRTATAGNGADVEAPIYTWRGTPGKLRAEIGKYYRRGMRIDHALMSRSLTPSLESVIIAGRGADRQGFIGSDHCPVVVTFRHVSDTAHLAPLPTNELHA